MASLPIGRALPLACFLTALLGACVAHGDSSAGRASALATTGLHLGHGSESGFFHTLAIPLFIFTNFIIALLLIRTFALLMQGKLLIRIERAALLKSEDK